MKHFKIFTRIFLFLITVNWFGCGEVTSGPETAEDPMENDGDGDSGREMDSVGEVDTELFSDEDDQTCDENCIFPVADHVDLTYVVWAEPGIHFYIPKPAWAMAATQASRMLAYYFSGSLKYTVSPNWFLATALKESFLGCCPDTPADGEHPSAIWKYQAASQYDGCFQIESTTAFVEMQRIFPNHFSGMTHSEVIAGCNVESSALTMAFYNTFAYGMMYKWVDDADAFFSSAKDPMAIETAFSLAYNRGVWSNEFTTAIGKCANATDMLTCVFGTVDTVARDHAYAISRYIQDLDGAARDGRCYNGTLTAEDVSDYVDAISRILEPDNVDELREKAVSAFRTAANGDAGPFQSTFGAVLEVLESAPLGDPFPKLNEWYGVREPRNGYTFSWPDIEDTCESVAHVI